MKKIINIIMKTTMNKMSFSQNTNYYGLAYKMNIDTEGLKTFTYVDIIKILISMIDNQEEKSERQATQEDIDMMW